MIKIYLAIFFQLLFLFDNAQAQNISGVINSYAKVTSISENTLQIQNLSGPLTDFSAGNKILIIQMKGALIDRSNTIGYGEIIDLKEAGNYEFAVIKSISGTGPEYALEVYHLTRAFDPESFVQIVSVPQYINATVTGVVTAEPWDRNSGIGGVVILDVINTLTLQANIDVSGQGFTGGNFNVVPHSVDTDLTTYVNIGNNTNGQKGEGIALYGPEGDHGMGALANGGGGGNSHNAGGGGGGNHSSGGIGGDSYRTPYGGGGIGGKILPYNPSVNKLFMGGGGGGGQQNNNNASRGASGGGILIIKAGKMVSNCNATWSVKANGNSALNAPGNDGGGGGGAGGVIMLDISNYDLSCNINIEVKGGDGGSVLNTGRHGGGAGGGSGALLLPGNSGHSMLVINSVAGIPGKDCTGSTCPSTGTPGETCIGDACTGETSWVLIHPNNPPVANNDIVSTQEDVPVIIDVLANDIDPDGNTLTVSSSPITNPAHGTLAFANNVFTYTPNQDYFGTDSFTYSVCDNGDPSLCATANVSITITAVNDAPLAVNDIAVTEKNVAVNIDVLSNDSDIEGDALVISGDLVQEPANGLVILNDDNSFTYTPKFNFIGNDSFIYEICDDGTPSMCSSAMVSITVNNKNYAPIATDDLVHTMEDVPVIIDVLAKDTDPDGDQLAVSPNLISAPSNGSVILINNFFTYTPNENFYGTDSFAYEICDNGEPSLCSSANVEINIEPVNDAPIAEDDHAITEKNIAVTINILDNDWDIENDDLMISGTLIQAPANGSVILNSNQTFTYTPNFNFTGNDAFMYQICDNGTPSECSSAMVTIEIRNKNYPPVANDDWVSTMEDEAVFIDVLANDMDPDGDGLKLAHTPVKAPSHGKVSFKDNQFIYTPKADFHGNDSFTYKVCDDGMPEYCATATVYITVLPVNDAPVAVDDEYANKDVILAIKGNVLDNDYDIDGDQLSVDANKVAGPYNGKLDIKTDGSFTYIPNSGFMGEDHFTYYACDDGTPPLCAQATVTLRISAGIPKGFSPNDDGVNDEWIITGIEEYPNNKVVIVNRYGDLVFEMNGYNNIDKVWKGHSNKGMKFSQNMLPDGTYYYVIDLGNGFAPGKGFVIIKR